MVGGREKQTVYDDIPTSSFPAATALLIGALAGAATWFIIYHTCPKPPFLDRILDWWHADPRERPTTTAAAAAAAATVLDDDDDDPGTGGGGGGGPSRNDFELQDRSARRVASPTGTTGTISSGRSGFSTPEPPLLDTSDEQSE